MSRRRDKADIKKRLNNSTNTYNTAFYKPTNNWNTNCWNETSIDLSMLQTLYNLCLKLTDW